MITYAFRPQVTGGVIFAGKNVMFVKDNISYFVYAKMLTSDDANVKVPGSNQPVDLAFRKYQIPDSGLTP